MMLSRVANSIYWMARYIERAENTARLINVNTHLLLDLPKRVQLGWEPILDITSCRDDFFAQHESADERSVIRYMVTDRNNTSSILNSLELARSNARTIRDIIPREAWEQVNNLCLSAREKAQRALTQRHRYDYLGNVILSSQTINGLLAGTMLHDEGYHFLRLGRNLERADMTTRIIDVRSASLLPELEEEHSTFENLQWMSVLKSMTAYQAYRRDVRLRIRRPDVLKFLLQQERFPRAFGHTLNQIEQCLAQLPGNENATERVTKLQRKLKRAKPETLKQDKLHDFIDALQLGLIKIDQSIASSYF
ncbi:MAG: alpha-E domain-containing protein [Wenzhouxiangellaceae bacterium]